MIHEFKRISELDITKAIHDAIMKKGPAILRMCSLKADDQVDPDSDLEKEGMLENN